GEILVSGFPVSLLLCNTRSFPRPVAHSNHECAHDRAPKAPSWARSHPGLSRRSSQPILRDWDKCTENAMRSARSCLAACCVTSIWLISPPIAADYWERHTIDNTSRGADGVRLGDVNGDGRPDIATPWEEGGVVCVYLHPGVDAVKAPWPAVTV